MPLVSEGKVLMGGERREMSGSCGESIRVGGGGGRILWAVKG